MADKKYISNIRSQQIDRGNDSFKEPTVGLYDVDEAIHYYFENIIQPRVKDGESEIRVPIVYGSPERWSSVQKSGVFRDETGKIQLPLIMYRRTSVEKNRNLSKKLDANTPNLHVTFETQYNQTNRYDNFDVLVGRKPSRKFHSVVIPDYVTLSYECIIWTDFIQHQNKIIEDINYASDAYWGKPNAFKFLATLDSFDIQNDLVQGSDRMSKANFTLNMSGYIIPNNLQKDMTQFNKTHYGVAEVNLFTTDVTVVNDLNEVYDGAGNLITKQIPDSNLANQNLPNVDTNPDNSNNNNPGWVNIND